MEQKCLKFITFNDKIYVLPNIENFSIAEHYRKKVCSLIFES